jgi:uncharacterized protein DUF4325
MQISVLNCFGPICADPDDGGRLCDQTRQALESGDCVVLDFSGVTTLTSAFLNAAIGCLFGSFAVEELDRRLSWIGLDKTDESLMRLVRSNAVRFFAANTEQRARMIAAENNAVGRL